GPHEAEDAGQRVWRLSCAGRAQVALLIRRPTSQEGGLPAPPLLLARQDVRQVLAPERLLADYDFAVEVLHNSVQQLVFDCSPAREREGASLPTLDPKGGDLRPGAAGRKHLVVTLREPFRGLLPPLRVRALAPLPADQRWASPGVALRGAVPRGESLTLEVPP